MKRLIVLCDGTGQSVTRGTEAISTNVKRFGDCLAQSYTGPDGKQHPQILYYQSGVGTATTGDISKGIALGTGAGIADNILDAYAFLCNNYATLPSDSPDRVTDDPNADEICIFGFSRGAFTARLVANLVLRLGLLKPQQLWLLKPAWAQYMSEDTVQRKNDRPDINFEFFVRHLHAFTTKWTRKVKVKVLGVWDTVGAMGLPEYAWVEAIGLDSHDKLYDIELREGTEYAFHALSIDEHRLPFGPTLFHYPDPNPAEQKASRNTPVSEKTILKQCWFAGSHSDVGGGYPSEHQANISLAWMIDQCLQYKLLEFDTTEKYGRFQVTIRHHLSPANLVDRLHREEKKWFGASPAQCEKKYPGWGCGIIRDSFKEMTLAVSWQYRAPGNYSSPRMCEEFPNKYHTHPGAQGRGNLPGTDTFEAGKEAIAGLFNKVFGGAGKPSEDEYCTEEGCRHPIRSWNGPGGTNETIHASVWARFEALKQLKLKEAAKKGSAEKSEFLDIQWAPPALSAFLRNGEYRREPVGNDDVARKFGYTHKWVGRCIVSKKLFAMYEEPDNLKPGDEIGELQIIDPNTKTTERLKYPQGGMTYQIHYDPDSKTNAPAVGWYSKELDDPLLGISQERKKELEEIRWKYRQSGFDCNEWRRNHPDWEDALEELLQARERKNQLEAAKLKPT